MLNSILEYKLKEKSLFLLIIGLFFNVRINLIGQLYFGELVLFILGMIYFKNFLKVFAKVNVLKISTFLFFLGLVMILVTNTIHGVGFERGIKGVANQVFYFSSLVGFIVLLKDNLDGIALFFLGKAIGNLIFFQYVNIDFSKNLGGAVMFEVYYATSLSFIVLIAMFFFEKPKFIRWLIPILFGVVCVLNDARSIGMVFFLVGMLGLISNWKIKVTKFRLMIIAAIGFPLLVMSFFTLGKSGYLGADSYKQFNNLQGNYKYISIFARSETLIGVIAWSDSPVIGHGSDAPGGAYYSLARALGLLEEYVRDKPTIPSHSVIVGAAVEAGTLAAVQWIYLFGFFFFLLVMNWKNRKGRYFLLIVYFILSTLWGFLFSPFGFARLQFTGYFAFIIIYLYEDRLLLAVAKDQLLRNKNINKSLGNG